MPESLETNRCPHGKRSDDYCGECERIKKPAVVEYKRGAQTVRRFSQQEDLLITRWRIAGHGTTAIAHGLFVKTGYLRSPATINMRLKSLAAIEERGN